MDRAERPMQHGKFPVVGSILGLGDIRVMTVGRDGATIRI